MTSVCDIPPELLCKPKALIGLSGIDLQNPVHKSVWEAFSANRRTDRVPLHFKIFPVDHEFPKSKPKRTSYDWYVPKGLLKTGWLRKHLQELPAVAAVFFDLDWDEATWREKILECASRVETVRKSLANRGTKVAVVLIQKRAPLPPGEDVTAHMTERAQALCSACELQPKNLYVLPHTDFLFGYIMRLETALNELAMNYYHNEIKRVKSHKESLNKTTHQLLFVRHQLKIAFFNELKQDTSLPLKHYRQAYSNLLELRMHDTHLLEIKTVAGFINYKICRLSFQNNASDAISQFRKHTDFFKTLVGIPGLAFEHEGWMSQQFELLGDLFLEAIRLGLTALMTQHPGLYYLEAAKHAIARRRLAQALCPPSTLLSKVSPPCVTPSSPDSGSLENDLEVSSGRLSSLDKLSTSHSQQEQLEFFGQRAWRPGNQSIDPPDPAKEKEGIYQLQMKESAVKHSLMIVPLLNHAVNQFKKYRAHRMKQYPLVMMGEEYFLCAEYKKALTCFHRVTQDFRKERWWAILTSIWITSLKCSYLTGNVTDYMTTVLEIISEYSLCPQIDKARIQGNLNLVLKNQIPNPEPGCDTEYHLADARKNWQNSIDNYDPESRDAEECTIKMTNIASCVGCKMFFTNELFHSDESVILELYFNSSAPLPFLFSDLYVEFSNPAYNKYAHYKAEDRALGFVLETGKIQKFSFSIPPEKEDVGKHIKIESVCGVISSTDRAAYTILSWCCTQEEYQEQAFLPATLPRATWPGIERQLEWSCISNRPIADIIPREANLSMDLVHKPPLLVNEFYAIDLVVTNKETAGPIYEISLSVGLSDGQDFSLEQSTHICGYKPEFDGKFVARRVGIDLGTLESDKSATHRIYIKCTEPGDRKFTFEASYKISVPVDDRVIDCCCYKKESIWLPTVLPFESTVKIASLRFLPIKEIISGEAFILQVNLTNTSPWEIELLQSELELKSPVEFVDEKPESQVKNVCVKSLEGVSECQILTLPSLGAKFNAELGHYILQWRRKQESGDESVPMVESRIPLPAYTVECVPIGVTVDMPSHGVLRTPFVLNYTLENRTVYPQEVQAQMDLTDGFMYSGNRIIHLKVLPQSIYRLTYNLYPLSTGHLELPRLHLKLARYTGSEEQLLRSVPTHIFIKPSGKESVNNIV